MSICAALRKSVERAIENADLSIVVKGTIFVIVAIMLMYGGFVLASRENVAGAGATYVAAVFCLVFAFLSQFKKFSGLGFTGETWERKMQEADELIARLKSLAVVVTEPLLMLVPRLGQWDSALTRREQYDIVSKIEVELKRHGIDPADIDKAKSDIHRYTIHDLLAPIIDGVCEVTNKKVEALNSIQQSFPQATADHPEYAKALGAWREAVMAQQVIQSVRGTFPLEAAPGALRKAIMECPLLTEDERRSLVDRYREEMADLECYAEHHSFRRLSVWLEDA